MNKILDLLDEHKARNIFETDLLPLYPQYQEIVSVTITPYKKLIWETTYHVVIRYDIVFNGNDGKFHDLSIVCSGHSEEPREKVLEALEYLWESGFPSSSVIIPKPLFYSQEYRSAFYEAVAGENLLRFIKSSDFDLSKIKPLIEGAAGVFARLHQVRLPENDIFNHDNERIATVVPGKDKVLEIVGARFPEYERRLAGYYEKLIASENSFLDNSSERWLIHGDAHPENVICVSPGVFGLIDFTDMCSGDFARDLGAFSQQLEYKVFRKTNNEEAASSLSSFFIDCYFSISGKEMDEGLKKRIQLYYNFTAMRTAFYFLSKHDYDVPRAEYLLSKIRNI